MDVLYMSGAHRVHSRVQGRALCCHGVHPVVAHVPPVGHHHVVGVPRDEHGLRVHGGT